MNELNTKDFAQWSSEQVASWITSLGHGVYKERFKGFEEIYDNNRKQYLRGAPGSC